MNTAFGPVEEQIFDIRQRRWPICYRLEDENPRGIQNAREFLSGELQNAIRMVMNSAHEAVEDAISRLTPEALRFIEKHNDYDYFWTEDKDVGRWMTTAKACLLDLKLIRAYFEPKTDVNRYVYTWTYIGKLVVTRMKPNFPPIPPSDVKEKIEVDPAVPESQSFLPASPPPSSLPLPTPDDGARLSGGSLLTWLHGLWARRH